MLQVKNAGPFRAMVMPLANADGVDTAYALVKATFTIGDRPEVADEQVPINLADRHYGDPATTSIRLPSDLSLGKRATDVLLHGSAWAPGGKPAWQADVSVAVGPVAKTVRVFGDRVWTGRAGGAPVEWVAPFTRMPLVWERAYGGADLTDRGPAADPRNPAGVGFRAKDGSRPVAGMSLPNVEDPTALVTSPQDAPTPAGLSAVAPHWEPRKSYAGTYDESWQKSRAPYVPADFDLRFFQLAPPGLTTPSHLQGGELVDLRGVTPRGVVRFFLPRFDIRVEFRVDSAVHSRPGALETVILEPDEGRLILVWCASLPCDKKALRVREARIVVSPDPRMPQ